MHHRENAVEKKRVDNDEKNAPPPLLREKFYTIIRKYIQGACVRGNISPLRMRKNMKFSRHSCVDISRRGRAIASSACRTKKCI